MSLLEYSFLRTEADSTIVLFLCCEENWLNQELDFTISAGCLQIAIEGIGDFKSKNLEPVLYSYLQKYNTKVVFCDKKGKMLGEAVLPAFTNTIIR